MPCPKLPLIERLLARICVDDDGCWLWQGSLLRDGYAQICFAGSRVLVHRASYEYFIGPIPGGYEVDHTCHDPYKGCLAGPRCRHRRCLNPDHLEAVTRRVNQSRGLRAPGAASVLVRYCSRGHEFTPANTYIRPTGPRRCRTCHRQDTQRWYAQRKAAV